MLQQLNVYVWAKAKKNRPLLFSEKSEGSYFHIHPQPTPIGQWPYASKFNAAVVLVPKANQHHDHLTTIITVKNSNK